MTPSPAAAGIGPSHIKGNTFGALLNLTLIPKSSSKGGVHRHRLNEEGMVMEADLSLALDEIRAHLAAAGSPPRGARAGARRAAGLLSSARRPDGRHVLEPAICTIAGGRDRCELSLSPAALRVLHNEQPGAHPYPLDINDGLFFSESVGPRNEQADAYHKLVSESLMLIRRSLDAGGTLTFECLDIVGSEVQQLDAAFARAKINRPQDQLHQCYGPSSRHPYSKITLCRTVIPVRLGDSTVPFIYEKFLVAYSYLCGGRRKSTVTPLHTHPLNFETVYFTSYGPNSLVTEQEFRIVGGDGRALVGEDGTVNADLLHRVGRGDFAGVIFRPGPLHRIRPSEEPSTLRPFGPDESLASAGIIKYTDGLFRPHKVTVHDDKQADRETLYYAIDNYFGPVGKVILYNEEAAPNLWSHDDWER